MKIILTIFSYLFTFLIGGEISISISEDLVNEYLELIDKRELKYILEMYGADKKQIKRVM